MYDPKLAGEKIKHLYMIDSKFDKPPHNYR